MTTNELILAIVTLLLTGGGLTSIHSLFKRNKNLKIENETLKDKSQDVKISKIETTLDWIVEKFKAKDDREQLYFEIKKKIDQILIFSKLQNTELQHLIFNSQNSYKNIIDTVLRYNFKMTAEELATNCEHFLKNNKKIIDRKKLNIGNEADNFLQEIETSIIRPCIQKYVIEYQNLLNLENGVRRKQFAVISKDFISSIVTKTIQKYSTYLQSV